jgi:hypothetical protein
MLARWGDGAVALVFACWVQLDLWRHAPATMHVVGGRGVFAVLLMPLALRRRAPAATLLVATGALVLVVILVSDANGAPVECFWHWFSPSTRSGAQRRSPLDGGRGCRGDRDSGG